MSDDERLERVRRLLREAGLEQVRVGVAGFAGDIAALEAPLDLLPRIRAVSEQVKAIGFSYVAIALAPQAAPAADAGSTDAGPARET